MVVIPQIRHREENGWQHGKVDLHAIQRLSITLQHVDCPTDPLHHTIGIHVHRICGLTRPLIVGIGECKPVTITGHKALVVLSRGCSCSVNEAERDRHRTSLYYKQVRVKFVSKVWPKIKLNE